MKTEPKNYYEVCKKIKPKNATIEKAKRMKHGDWVHVQDYRNYASAERKAIELSNDPEIVESDVTGFKAGNLCKEMFFHVYVFEGELTEKCENYFETIKY